jgi:inorganic pyrophosphatase
MPKSLPSKPSSLALLGVVMLLLAVGLYQLCGADLSNATEKTEPSHIAAGGAKTSAECQDVSDSPAARLAGGPVPIANDLHQVDGLTIVGKKSLYDGHPARNDDGTVNVVVEIPAGTNAKWEVNKEGAMTWEVREGVPRIVNFLPYPGNYGMIPSTLSPQDQGGDGDALDVLILGPALPRGTIARVQLIGVMKFLDKGEQDDKFLAVMQDTPLGEMRSLKELNESFPGVAEIVHLWFTSYKGPGKMEFQGWGDIDTAEEILQRGIDASK